MATDDFCYLTTTGRRSGRPHRIEIWFAQDGDTLYLLAGGGHAADWVQNLTQQRTVTVEVDGAVHAANARVVDAPAESERTRALVFDKYQPRYNSDLTRWRETALPVALDLEA